MAFNYQNVKNPEYFRENRMEAHSDHKFYQCLSHAIEKEEDFQVSLNGLWKFSYAKNIESTIQGFEKKEYDCKSWDDIKGTIPYTVGRL